MCVMYKIKDARGGAYKGLLGETEVIDTVLSNLFCINYTILLTAVLD